MKARKVLIFNYITLMLFCQFIPCCSAMTISEAQQEAIVDRCDVIRDSLKNVQRVDARARTYLGGYYETILTKFITPLNIRLVENHLSAAALVENQNNFADTRALFANDFVVYQQMLEELVAVDCKNKPEEFYEKLVATRQRRKTMTQDVLKMRNLISEHVRLVSEVRSEL